MFLFGHTRLQVAEIFARTALQLLVAVSLADCISRFTFSAAAVAAARACSLRATTLSCASFFAAATASSACLARTDSSASCSESGLGMGFTPCSCLDTLTPQNRENDQLHVRICDANL